MQQRHAHPAEHDERDQRRHGVRLRHLPSVNNDPADIRSRCRLHSEQGQPKAKQHRRSPRALQRTTLLLLLQYRRLRERRDDEHLRQYEHGNVRECRHGEHDGIEEGRNNAIGSRHDGRQREEIRAGDREEAGALDAQLCRTGKEFVPLEQLELDELQQCVDAQPADDDEQHEEGEQHERDRRAEHDGTGARVHHVAPHLRGAGGEYGRVDVELRRRRALMLLMEVMVVVALHVSPCGARHVGQEGDVGGDCRRQFRHDVMECSRSPHDRSADDGRRANDDITRLPCGGGRRSHARRVRRERLQVVERRVDGARRRHLCEVFGQHGHSVRVDGCENGVHQHDDEGGRDAEREEEEGSQQYEEEGAEEVGEADLGHPEGLRQDVVAGLERDDDVFVVD